MANDTVTFVGNITSDPILRGDDTKRVAFRVAVNKKIGEEEKTDFIPVTAFGTLAENIAASIKKGMRVLVNGRFNSYEKPVEIDGEEKNISMLAVTADSVGPDLRWATATVEKVTTGRSNAPAAAPAEAPAEAPKRKPAAAAAGRTKASKPAPAPADDDLF